MWGLDIQTWYSMETYIVPWELFTFHPHLRTKDVQNSMGQVGPNAHLDETILVLYLKNLSCQSHAHHLFYSVAIPQMLTNTTS